LTFQNFLLLRQRERDAHAASLPRRALDGQTRADFSSALAHARDTKMPELLAVNIESFAIVANQQLGAFSGCCQANVDFAGVRVAEAVRNRLLCNPQELILGFGTVFE
jgi:hypothetical protein